MTADEKDPPKAGAKAGRASARRAKPPVTIDLEANPSDEKKEDLTAAAGAGEAAAPAPETASETGESEAEVEPPRSDAAQSAPVRSEPQPVALALAAAAGGLIVLLLGFGLQAAGILPAPGRSAATEALAEADRVAGTVSGLDQRVTALESAGAQAIADRAFLDDVAKQVGTVNAFGTSLSDRLLNVEASIAALKESVGEAATRQELDDIAARVQRLETAPSPAGDGAPQADLAALAGRIDALESEVAALAKKVDSLAAAPATTSAGEPAARTVAITALRRSAAAGGAFADDLAMVGALGVGGPQLAELEPFAEKGVPSRAALEAEFPSVAEAILAARPSSRGDAGLLDRVIAYGRDLVKIRPAGPVAGDSPSAVVSRMEAAVASGDLAAALEERKALPGAGQAASQEWADAAADRIDVDRLVDEIAGAAAEGGRANSG